MASSATSDNALPETRPQNQHIINIPDPEHIDPVVPDQCCIYKVPVHLRKLNDEAYTPLFISIGPLHSNNPELKQEKQKQRYFHAFWSRLSNKQAFEQYEAFLVENKEKIGNWYSEPELCKKDQFVDMIMLDSVFIMELFLRKSTIDEQKKDHMFKNDHMFTTSWICKTTQRDLLLLENQLPMFVLEELHKRVWFWFLGDNIGIKENRGSFLELAFNYFEDYYPQKSSKKSEMIKNCRSCKHFTDLIRYTYLPTEIQVNGVDPSKNFAPCKVEYVPKTATKLNEAGVSFEGVQGRSYLDIKFNKTPILSWFLCLGCLPFSKHFEARLQIPQLKVHQSTECVLRNLIALEQCHYVYSDQPFVCNYVSLIDSLIHTQDDVELLVDKEAIVHELGSHKELATMVNDLCKHVVVTCNYYDKTIKKLNKHYNNCWKHNMGMLRSVYFRDPWRVSSTVVGVVVFLFTVANFLRVIGVLRPNY